ncbi:MAG: DMT family transporter [Gammaproteobacteria bacterium]|nr:DMT family transporter [Gammaproteobacteria bacterium]
MHDRLIKGASFILLSELFFVLMGIQVRTVAETLPNEMVVFFRNLFGLHVLIPLLLKQGFSTLKTEQARYHLLRGLAGVTAMYCFFYAIAHLPLANAMILKMSAPLFIPLIAYLWLKEQLNWLIAGVVLLGFMGVTLIIKPDFEGLDMVAMVALAGGFFAAIAKSTVKKLTRTESPTTIVFYFALTGLVVSSIPAIISWQTPNTAQLLQLLLLGMFAASGQYFMTQAYALAPASQISHFSYSSILYAAIIGWWLWEEWMDLWAWTGAVMVVISGLLLIKYRRA